MVRRGLCKDWEGGIFQNFCLTRNCSGESGNTWGRCETMWFLTWTIACLRENGNDRNSASFVIMDYSSYRLCLSLWFVTN